MTKNPLLDKDFLRELDAHRSREVYAKVIALSFDEQPLDEMEGRVTAGSINIDGNSAVRRSCSLTFIALDLDRMDINDYYWGLKNKFQLFIGLKNEIDPSYPEIIWFKQGTYVITSFNTSQNTNSYQISIQGKDKMCLLNGDLGGVIESLTWTFNTYKKYDPNGHLTTIDIPIKTIIQEVVHKFANEPMHNIIVNDLDDFGLELLEYRGSKTQPMYLLVDSMTNEVTNMSMNGNQGGYTLKDGTEVTLATVPFYNQRIQLDLGNITIDPSETGEEEQYTGTTIYATVNGLQHPYTVMKVSYGETCGYRITDLTYAGDLIGNVGEAVTTACLDKIKNMLGEFEYFYDLDGKFIFQRKKTYVRNSWNGIINSQDIADEDMYVNSAAYIDSVAYHFEDGTLISAYQNTPNLTNLKNDFSIWGERKSSASKTPIPIHLRYAIDKKPVYYKNFNGQIFTTREAIFEQLRKETENSLIKDLITTAQNFKPLYQDAMPATLKKAEKNPDGSWTAGWWDIRDWYNYYKSLTGMEPNATMKWYSHNNADGCTRVNDYYCWLIIATPKPDGSYTYNLQHGSSSSLSTSSGHMCSQYVSSYNPDGTYTTVATGEKKFFMFPYAGCNDRHTYIDFLENDIKKRGNSVYFYNPKFPHANSYDEFIKNTVEQKFQQLIDDKVLNFVDWREIIYQMALDYKKGGRNEDFYRLVAENNPDYYPDGYTGYETYYTDMEGFWRQLYNPDIKPLDEPDNSITYYTWENDTYVAHRAADVTRKKNPGSTTYYKYTGVGATGYEAYDTFTEFNKNRVYFIQNEKGDFEEFQFYEFKDSSIQYYNNSDFNLTTHWCLNITRPELLNFWFDFLDADEDDSRFTLGQFSVQVVGNRPKAIKDSNVKAIYFRDTPTVVFVNADKWDEERDVKSGYTYVRLSKNIENLFTISAQGKSAKTQLDELLYKHSYCVETISITAVPIYYLQPNTRIYVRDDSSNIDGEYIVSRLTIPLTYNGTMNISATKAAESIT